MNVLLDLLGSSFVGGMVLLLILKLNMYGSNQRYSSDSELQLQQNAKTQAEILDYDLRKIGYGCDSTSIAIAQDERITFYADIDTNGTVDVVTYFVDKKPTPGTSNPDDVVLTRVVNSDTLAGPSLGLVKLKFSYFDSKKNITTLLSKIKFVKVELWVETLEPVESFFTKPEHPYPFTYWEMTISPRNI
jgi:hypothetical protein